MWINTTIDHYIYKLHSVETAQIKVGPNEYTPRHSMYEEAKLDPLVTIGATAHGAVTTAVQC